MGSRFPLCFMQISGGFLLELYQPMAYYERDFMKEPG